MSLVSSNQVETNRTELTVEVKGEKFQKAVDAAVAKNMKKITIPGFRKGKAPRAMVEKMYGKGMFYEDAMNALYPEAYSEAVDAAGIKPVDSADVEVLEVNDEGFTFKATVTTKPVPELGEYKGLSAVKAAVEVTDEQIEHQFAHLRDQYARVIEVTDRAAKLGDIADINFEGFVDGVAFEGGKGENHPLTLGSGSFIPGFEDQVVGHSVGEEFDVNVTFPEEYGEKSLAGKASVFKVKINGIKERQLPEVDDEFAKDVSEFDTLEEFKKDMKAKMIASAEEKAAADFENKLLEQVVANMKVDVPDCMIESRVRELMQDFAMRMSQQGLSLKDFLQYSGQTEEQFKETFRPQAESQVKTRLAMEAIAEAEKIVPTEEEIEEEYKKLSEQYHTELEKLRGIISAAEISEDVACRKALEIVRESASALPEEKKEDSAEEEAPKPKRTRKTKAEKEAEAAAE
ncbi:trigger factor [Yanshouia hominis]|uniref:Trigger factor n=1 Tax=Yanshouia hominis TaxID=2763673 RepID=A0ABR7NJH2_9FIRM|nr:trigger factor [Yanshouia hominis]MBC8576557.1 trigger factor [Yanshouia hominis]